MFDRGDKNEHFDRPISSGLTVYFNCPIPRLSNQNWEHQADCRSRKEVFAFPSLSIECIKANGIGHILLCLLSSYFGSDWPDRNDTRTRLLTCMWTDQSMSLCGSEVRVSDLAVSLLFPVCRFPVIPIQLALDIVEYPVRLTTSVASMQSKAIDRIFP